jgi:RNA polymerase sigma factor (sigma-70 family)
MKYDLDDETVILKAQTNPSFIEDLLPALEAIIMSATKQIVPTAHYNDEDIMQDGMVAAIEAIYKYKPGRTDCIAKYIWVSVANRVWYEAGSANAVLKIGKGNQHKYYRAKKEIRKNPNITKKELMQLDIAESIAVSALMEMDKLVSMDKECAENGENMYGLVRNNTNIESRALTNAAFCKWAKSLTETEKYYINGSLRGMTYKEMAEERGVTPSAPEMCRLRAKARLKKELGVIA